MKKLLPFLIIFVLFSCKEKDKRFVGIWKIQEININGATMYHEDIGQPIMEFNDKGGYMLKMGNTLEKGGIKNPVEKGVYTIKDGKYLTITPKSADKPKQDLIIDTVSKNLIRYHSQTKDNRMDVMLVRVEYLEHTLKNVVNQEKK